MAQRNVTFTYNDNSPQSYSDWEIEIEPHSHRIDIDSAGTGTKTSDEFNLNHINSTITFSVTGGYGFAATYKNEDNDKDTDSLYCNLYAELWFKKADGSSVRKTYTEAGSAVRGGEDYEYHEATPKGLSYTPTAADRAAYKTAYFVFKCSTSSDHKEVERYSSDTWKHTRSENPYGIISFMYRDNINVDYVAGSTRTTMQDLTADGTDIRKLVYNGSTIYE